jgi:hypothetical protein
MSVELCLEASAKSNTSLLLHLLNLTEMKNYSNIAEAIIDLQLRGYDQDFVIKNEHILCVQDSELISPDEFEVISAYKFERGKRLRDNYVIYAIRSMHNDLKGILMTSYAAFTKGLSIHLWSKLAADLK